MKDTVDIKTSAYFNGMPYVVGVILAPVGFILLFSPHVIIGAGLAVAGIIIISSHYRLRIDYSGQQYSEYIWLLGVKIGMESKPFKSVEYLFVKKVKVNQTLNSRASSTTIEKIQYDGFLKFSEDDKIHLMTCESKSTLLKRLAKIGSQLNLKILDYAHENPIVE